MDYKTSGVDVQAGRSFVGRIKASVDSTSRPEVIGGLGGFGGLIRLPAGLTNPILVAGTDGVGTKLELAQAYNTHFGVGLDLVAMCVNDVITSGAEPLFFLDYIATGFLTPEALTEVVEGIADGCKRSGCALLGGETAEMPGFYSKGRYDLAGFCVAVVEESKLIKTSQVNLGDKIIGVASSGLHSNGFSLVRKVLKIQNADENTLFGQNNLSLIKTLLKPTAFYVQLVKALMHEKLPINGLAHITGGGLPENLPRCLPKGLTAFIDTHSWKRPEIYSWLQQSGDIPESDLWNTFNLGVGFCLVVEPQGVGPVLEVCKSQGLNAWTMGHVAERSSSGEELIGLPK